MKRIIAVWLCALMLIGSVPFFGSADGTRQSEVLTLRIAIQDDIKGLNPITVSDDISWDILGYIYDGTINVDSDNNLIPYLAVGSANLSSKSSGWTWGDCLVGNFGFNRISTWSPTTVYGEAVVFYDFENVKWHDGHQMDIRDVMFSMHMAAQVPQWSASMNALKDLGGNAGTNYSMTSWLHVYKVWEEGHKAALKFVLQSPYAGFFSDTLSTFMLPEHIWAYKVSGQAVDGVKIWCDPGYNILSPDAWRISAAQSYTNNPPIGNGPFKFNLRNVGQLIKITTNRDYFFDEDFKYAAYATNDDGTSLATMPLIDAITYKIYKTSDAAVLALKNDDIDYIAWSVPPSFVQQLASEPDIELSMAASPGFFYLAYNMRKSSFGYVDGNPANADAGKAFRRAVAHCIDKNRIVSRLLLGLGMPGDCPVNPTDLDWYDKNYIVSYTYDPTEAKTILANAGYKVKKSDGTIVSNQAAINAAGDGNWWVNPDGTNIGSSPGGRIDILTPEANYDPIRAQAGLMIADQLRTIGIYAESVAMDFGSIVDRIDGRDFDMYILGWSIGSDPTEYLWSFFHSINSMVGQNYPGYQNASFDSLIDQARNTGDAAFRKQYILQALTALTSDLPYDVLYYKTNIEAYRSDRFVGWVVGSSGSIYNWQSLQRIHPPSPYKVIAQFVTPPSAMTSSTTQPVTVLVKDQDGAPLSGANVWLSASLGSFSASQGVTDASGKFVAMFSAPYIPMPDASDPLYNQKVYEGTAVTITLKATYTPQSGAAYDPSPLRMAEIRIFPESAAFITLSIIADPDIIEDANEGVLGFTLVEVTVTDENGDPVANADVELSVSPPIPTVDQAVKQTDYRGKATFKVTAQDLAMNDGSINEFMLTADATHPTDSSIKGSAKIMLSIIDNIYSGLGDFDGDGVPDGQDAYPDDPENSSTSSDSGEYLWVILLGIVVAVVVAVAVLATRGRKGPSAAGPEQQQYRRPPPPPPEDMPPEQAPPPGQG